MSEDRRRRRYVPVDTLVAFSRFGAKLNDKWGMEGLCSWMLLLAAAKREPAQGIFTYTSEPEAWTKIGAVATSFTFDEFVTFCGRNKQTRKTRSGRITYVEITGWQQWNKAYKTQQDDERKTSKPGISEAGDAAEMRLRSGGDVAPKPNTESEGEFEGEAEPSAFKIPDPLARLVASLPDKTPLTIARIESMHRKYGFAEGDFEEAREAANSGGANSPSAVAISVLKDRGTAKEAA